MWCILTEQHLSVLEGDGKYKNVTGEFCLAENPNDLWHSNTDAAVLQALGGGLCKVQAPRTRCGKQLPRTLYTSLWRHVDMNQCIGCWIDTPRSQITAFLKASHDLAQQRDVYTRYRTAAESHASKLLILHDHYGTVAMPRSTLLLLSSE